MQDGSQVKGSFAGGSADEIKVVVAGQTLTFKTAHYRGREICVRRCARPNPGTYANQSRTVKSSAQAGRHDHSRQYSGYRPPYPADSSCDSLGKEYRASLDEPLVNQSGQVVAPRGSDVVVVLKSRQESDHFAGKTELRLALRSLTIQGKRYDVSSTDIVEASSSRTAHSGKAIGGLAAAGAAIGAIAGGRKGAAVGAGSDATLGTLGQVFTSGQRVEVPSEMRLTFRLQEPLLLN